MCTVTTEPLNPLNQRLLHLQLNISQSTLNSVMRQGPLSLGLGQVTAAAWGVILPALHWLWLSEHYCIDPLMAIIPIIFLS